MTKASGSGGAANSRFTLGDATPTAAGGGLCAITWSCGLAGQVSVGDGAGLKAAAAQIDFGGAAALADDVRNDHVLRAQALGEPHMPAAADLFAGKRHLRQDAPLRDVGAVEAVFEFDQQPILQG